LKYQGYLFVTLKPKKLEIVINAVIFHSMLKRTTKFIREAWHHLRMMWVQFYRHGGAMMAAAISFYFLLSSVPLTMLGLSIAGMIIGSPEKAASLILTLANLQQLLPEGALHLGSFFRTFVSHASVVSKVSFILLFIFSGGVFLTVESAVNRVFERHEDRPLWRQLLFAYILMFFTYFALLGSAAVTWTAMLITDFGVSLLGFSSQGLSMFWRWFFILAPIAWVSLFFSIIYKIIPHRRIPWRYALAGGLFAGVAWEVAKRMFTLYIRYVVRFNELYGGISAVLATFVWIFYTASIMLLGAEMTMNFIRYRKPHMLDEATEDALERI